MVFTNFATSCNTQLTVYSEVSCYSLVNKDEYIIYHAYAGGSVTEWLACWTQAQKGRGSNRSRDATLLGSSLRQAVHTHRASVHQTAKLVAALLRVAGVTVGLAESNGSLPSGL